MVWTHAWGLTPPSPVFSGGTSVSLAVNFCPGRRAVHLSSLSRSEHCSLPNQRTLLFQLFLGRLCFRCGP